MMETHRNHDIQAAERIFKKVVHPGLESLRLVDRNGMPFHSPVNFRQRSFVLSPRGVPTRVSTHVYSGHHSHAARYSDAVNQLNSPDFYTEQSFVVPSSYETTRSAQQYGTAKKHSYHGRPPRHMQISKSATSERYLSSVPDEKRFLQSAGSRGWNRSNQSIRLEKEWASVANSRALKRNSEIVSHRVDRMYFMNGNSVKLQPRYHVDEDQLNELRELSKSRQSSRQQHRGGRHTPKELCLPSLENNKKEEKASSENIETAVEGNPVDKEKQSNEDVGDNKTKPLGRKSPLQGWSLTEHNQEEEQPEQTELIRKMSLHEGENDDVKADDSGNTEDTADKNDNDDNETNDQSGENLDKTDDQVDVNDDVNQDSRNKDELEVLESNTKRADGRQGSEEVVENEVQIGSEQGEEEVGV